MSDGGLSVWAFPKGFEKYIYIIALYKRQFQNNSAELSDFTSKPCIKP